MRSLFCGVDRLLFVLFLESLVVLVVCLVSSLSSAHLPKGCRMPSSSSSLVFGIFVEVEIGSLLVFGISVEIGVGGGGVSLRCSCLMASISPVSIALYSSSVNVKNSETDLS